MAEGDRPALYHMGIDQQLAGFYRDAFRLSGDGQALPLIVQDSFDVVFDLDSDEVMMKLRAIDCHRSQLEEWRILIRDHPRLMQEGYGHDPYIAIASRTPTPGANGLMGDFAGTRFMHVYFVGWQSSTSAS